MIHMADRGEKVTMNSLRFTIVGSDGAVSFVYDGSVLPHLLEACRAGGTSLQDFLEALGWHDPRLREHVSCGLAVFDEHNVDGCYASIHQAIQHFRSDEWPVFRVVDDITREASLRPTRTGVIIFNLVGRRIVQMHNGYDQAPHVSRQVRQLQRAGWQIVP